MEILKNLSRHIRDRELNLSIPFTEFLKLTADNPRLVLRDIFQLFYDMVHHYVPQGEDEYPDTGQSIGFMAYNTSKLFIEGCDNPFFADRLFANRFMKLISAFREGVQNNRIYLFEGPPGSGKSTFLNNLLQHLEEYSKNKAEGKMYKIRWVLDTEKIVEKKLFEKVLKSVSKDFLQRKTSNKLEFSCPNHDHPILLIPVNYRKEFLNQLIPDNDFKEELFNSEQYKWVLKDIPCSICSSLFSLLLDILGDPMAVFEMVYARVATFNRQFGEGISIFNPGDPLYEGPMSNPVIQESLNSLFNNDEIKFVHSYLAKTNNGILALMDIKEHNIQRLMSLHGIISDGIHKVGSIEERIKTMFVGLVNPEDKHHYENVKSFQDRITTVNVPYILDFNTEVSIYVNKFGKNISKKFLPRVLDNFAKIIISTRLEMESPSITKWLINPYQYTKYIDKNLFLLKMDLYAGRIPTYLTEEDSKRFDKETRKKVIDNSESEGRKGFSGRKSLNIFNEFYAKYSKTDKLISMNMVVEFFKTQKDFEKDIPNGFIESLVDLYDFNIVQEVKESIYYYNEEQISRDIQNYLFAINFELNETKLNSYTGDTLEITEDYLKNFEAIFLGATSLYSQRVAFRKDNQKEYVTKTLAQETNIKGMKITETEQFKMLFEKYTRNLKENSLAPYAENMNFRRAIIDYNTSIFNNYDERIKRDVNLLITNLVGKFKYTTEGAQQVMIYLLDKKIGRKY